MNDPAARIDLLPAWRRHKRARRAAVSRWITACVLVAVGSLAPAGAMALSDPSSGPEVAERIARSERSIGQLKAEQPVLRRELATLQRTAALLGAIEDRPDWRPLLHAITEAAGPARFERIETALVRDGVPEIRVTVLVLVEGQPEARAMVLRFEELGLFDEVALSSSTRVAVAQTEVVRCEITARLRLGGGGAR
jgi:hypothetical protein